MVGHDHLELLLLQDEVGGPGRVAVVTSKYVERAASKA
jgi:hypothetical protein